MFAFNKQKNEYVYICKLLVANIEIAKKIILDESVLEIWYNKLGYKKNGDISVIQPTFKKIREDKTVSEITTLDEIVGMIGTSNK
jgi:hypothetical protein